MLYDPTKVVHPYTTAKTLMVRLCTVHVVIVDSYVHSWGLSEYSAMIVTGLFGSTCTLISFLYGRRPSPMDQNDDATITDMVPEIFTRVCAIMRAVQREMARRYFDEIDSNRKQLKDVPMTTVMPVLEELKKLLGQNDVGADNWGEGGELGRGVGGVTAVLE